MMDVKKKSIELSSMRKNIESTERNILSGSKSRLDEVNSRIEELNPTAIINKQDGIEYQNLILERGRLNLVISRSEKLLSGD